MPPPSRFSDTGGKTDDVEAVAVRPRVVAADEAVAFVVRRDEDAVVLRRRRRGDRGSARRRDQARASRRATAPRRSRSCATLAFRSSSRSSSRSDGTSARGARPIVTGSCSASRPRRRRSSRSTRRRRRFQSTAATCPTASVVRTAFFAGSMIEIGPVVDVRNPELAADPRRPERIRADGNRRDDRSGRRIDPRDVSRLARDPEGVGRRRDPVRLRDGDPLRDLVRLHVDAVRATPRPRSATQSEPNA